MSSCYHKDRRIEELEILVHSFVTPTDRVTKDDDDDRQFAHVASVGGRQMVQTVDISPKVLAWPWRLAS